jgi:hypothetical protein
MRGSSLTHEELVCMYVCMFGCMYVRMCIQKIHTLQSWNNPEHKESSLTHEELDMDVFLCACMYVCILCMYKYRHDSFMYV